MRSRPLSKKKTKLHPKPLTHTTFITLTALSVFITILVGLYTYLHKPLRRPVTHIIQDEHVFCQLKEIKPCGGTLVKCDDGTERYCVLNMIGKTVLEDDAD